MGISPLPRWRLIAGGTALHSLVLVLVFSATGCLSGETSRRPLATGYVSDQIDILFVVDNSGSMFAEQLQLGKSFGSFIERIESASGTNTTLPL